MDLIENSQHVELIEGDISLLIPEKYLTKGYDCPTCKLKLDGDHCHHCARTAL
jgi:hypothetical protein